MPTYVVSYDLKKPGQDYEDLIEYLKSFDIYSHTLKSTWVIKTDLTSVQLRDGIKKHTDANDKVLVVQSAGVGAWRGLAERTTEWLKKHL